MLSPRSSAPTVVSGITVGEATEPGVNLMRATALLIGTSLVAIATPALAQTQAERTAQAVNPPPNASPAFQNQGAIIVTATKRASTVQEVPFSVNAQTQADLERAH